MPLLEYYAEAEFPGSGGSQLRTAPSGPRQTLYSDAVIMASSVWPVFVQNEYIGLEAAKQVGV
jgi:hypothetical protein